MSLSKTPWTLVDADAFPHRCDHARSLHSMLKPVPIAQVLLTILAETESYWWVYATCPTCGKNFYTAPRSLT